MFWPKAYFSRKHILAEKIFHLKYSFAENVVSEKKRKENMTHIFDETTFEGAVKFNVWPKVF
jgi:hypothetical protein